MHDTALYSGQFFSDTYGTNKNGGIIVDIGGLNLNGSLRSFFSNMKYICLDMEPHPSVDIVVKPGEKLPFDDQSVDLIVSSSCFEHDPCFWITFREMCRIIKTDGFIYISAPANGPYHKHPGDNWRFYPDAGQALSYWSGYQMGDEKVYPVSIEETFFIYPLNDLWIDFVCIWKRIEEKESNIIVSDEIKNKVGPLKQKLIDNNFTVTNSPTDY